MSHKYYIQDQDNPSRMEYFDDWFKILSKEMAKQKGITSSAYLSQITNFTSFKAILKEVFSLDGSLANYVDGFDNKSFRLFYERNIIQEILEANEEKDKEYFKELKEETPQGVAQVKKEVEEYFRGVFVEKKTGKEKKVVAKKESVKVRGKSQVRYRDSKGRFIKRL